jgi:hypothetical protein
MPTILGNKYLVIAFSILALAVIIGSTFLVYEGKMQEGSFESLIILILSVFGVTASVATTGHVIQQTNGAKETTTTTLPPGNTGVTVTTVKESQHES